ncbi:uncharacterized protein LOC114719456 [Neltuma alba]|uniref:uncharacterized protein LOC114719456 n=1 Tax=Neltuma alba TaxID=207710 RepID=UPI0010A45809|nr:uncharacterized protein LOC114719456 [Prosopis alba]
MKFLKTEKILGEIIAEIYTIEFQKRGLPHAHILLFLHPRDKIKDPEAIDAVVCAEIPDKSSSPILYELVKRYMIHGPCGVSNPKSPCMKERKCTKYFPKKYNHHTIVDEDGYPTYKQRDDGRTIESKGVHLDNLYVIPYNPILLQMFQGHINIEKCNHSTAVKYLFKYISKGNDRVVAALFQNNTDGNNKIIDEVQQYYNCRYISACEGAWRIFGFNIHHRNPAVERLSFHLPNQQHVIYANTDDVAALLEKPRDKRKWKRRKKGFAVGRMTHISPSVGELYYLRVLLTKVKGPSSFDAITIVDGIVYTTFKDACFAYGLLDDDNEYIAAIKEASVWATRTSLRKLFVSMLLSCSLQHPDYVWRETSKFISEDMLYFPRDDPTFTGLNISLDDKEQAALKDIDSLLRQNGKSLHNFPSLSIPNGTQPIDIRNHLIIQELSYDRLEMQRESIKLLNMLNADKKKIYDEVILHVEKGEGGFFFVYGYGGTGKTFLWNALTSTLRAKGDIVITVASSGIAATLLPSGRTAHSRFAIPIQINESSICSINQNTPLANLIKSTKLIIWDEAPMVQRLCVEAFSRSLQDIMQSSKPFGGKCIIMGGDFCQILPVIPKGNRASIVDVCINSSHLWDYCTIFKLTKNMRLSAPKNPVDVEKLAWFSQWLLDVGDGKLGAPVDGIAQIEIPKEILISNPMDPMHSIVQSTYSDLIDNLDCNEYFNKRAILAPTIEMVNLINEYMSSSLLGESFEFLSCDSVCKTTDKTDTFDDLYTTEFLNTINCSGMPPHKLILKVGAPIMLLRNIDQASGLCNGTRLRISKLGKSIIEAVTLNGSNPNKKVLIHRMDMNPSENRWPFRMQRRQFPISLSFAMTINKSQGQSLRYVSLYLCKPVFTHGQLYVALSRVKSMEGLKIVVAQTGSDALNTTTNVVYPEIFRNV